MIMSSSEVMHSSFLRTPWALLALASPKGRYM